MTISNELRVRPHPEHSTPEKTREKRPDVRIAPKVITITTAVLVTLVSENFDRVPNPNPATMVVDEPQVVV